MFKKKLFLLSLLILSVIFTACSQSNKSYKYIAINSTPYSNTQLSKVGTDNSIISTKKSKIKAIALSGFMEQPQVQNGLIYQTAAVSETPVDFALVQINSTNLRVQTIPGIRRASSFLVCDDAIYTFSCNNPSRIAKTIFDEKGKPKVILEAELKGMISEAYEENNYIYTVANEDPDINKDFITITKVDKNTLKAIEKFCLPYNDSFGNVVSTDKYIYFSPLEKVKGVVSYNKQTTKCIEIPLFFNFITSIIIKNNFLYAFSSGEYTNENAKIAKIDLSNNKVLMEKELSYPSLSYYCGETKFTILDGQNLHELNLDSLEEINNIKLLDDRESRFNSFVSFEQIDESIYKLGTQKDWEEFDKKFETGEKKVEPIS